MTHIDDTILAGKHHIHFIGVGGSGMFPIVQILLSQGYAISGSDNNPGETLDAEQAMGVTVYMGQRPENLKGAELVVYSAAIMEDNPELVAARQMGVPVVERSEMLGLLTRHHYHSDAHPNFIRRGPRPHRCDRGEAPCYRRQRPGWQQLHHDL